MHLSIFLHPSHLVLAQAAGSSDGDFLLFAGALIVRLHAENTVSIDVESNFNLRHSPRSRQDTIQHKPTQRPVVHGHRSLALEDMDFHAGLAISRRAENLALGSGDSSIASN